LLVTAKARAGFARPALWALVKVARNIALAVLLLAAAWVCALGLAALGMSVVAI
jgi:hypothetical protein